MDRGVDIAVYSPDGRLQLVVETKSQEQTSRDWAARFRRNLLAHQVLPPSNYFLLAMPDHLYLWKDSVHLAEALPNYEMRTWEALRDYLSTWTEQPPRLGEESLQLALASWLSDLVSATRKLRPEAEVDRTLIESGLYDAIKSGEVRLESAA
jgi:uncharacterized protein (DUF2342 family)